MDLHRHGEFSSFDGFGNATEAAKQAKKLGYTALGLSDHGNTNGLVQHHYACLEQGIKPILGVEAYFLPYMQEKTRGTHLCLFAKNAIGYANLNKLQTIGETQKYYNPIITFKDLQEHHEGLICTTACVASYFAKCILKGEEHLAEEAIIKFMKIFGDDFYIEIQPYKCDENYTQENVNYKLMMMADKLGAKCILTSDSHYPSKEDYDTYIVMHRISRFKKTNPKDEEVRMRKVKETYKERYMPTQSEFYARFCELHRRDFDSGDELVARAGRMFRNMELLEESVEPDILGNLDVKLPVFEIDGKPATYKDFVEQVQKGLRKRHKWTHLLYRKRAKEEAEIIFEQGYIHYFLMVADYVNWAKKQGIAVGPGRGSACNSIVCYALGITDVDSERFGLVFSRFMRRGKNKMPDIDIDFETRRRGEVINYIVNKYKGYSAQVCSYGLYKVDNLVNDLAKMYNITDKATIVNIKKTIKRHGDDSNIDMQSLSKDRDARLYNHTYPNFMKHFSKLYKKVKYIGTHAAGVAISGNPIENYTALRHDGDRILTNYDLVDVEKIGVIKFDILGLKTEEGLAELREITGESYQEDWLTDENVLKAFGEGNTDGIFQFEKQAPKQILKDIKCDCTDDIIAVNAMNRPAMLDLDMHKKYAKAKKEKTVDESTPYYEYVKDTYGCVIYQEQVLKLATEIGGFTEDEADILVKMEHGASSRTKQELDNKYYNDFYTKFCKNAISKGVSEEDAKKLFQACAQYGFNKGHATAYSMIAVEEMYYKLYHTTEFWCVKIKNENSDANKATFKAKAVANGALVFLPHVNYSAYTSIRTIDGDKIIQEGLIELKGIGAKAAEAIEEERKNGKFKNKEDFIKRCKSRAVTKKIINILEERGALDFDQNLYMNKVKKYNVALHSRSNV